MSQRRQPQQRKPVARRRPQQQRVTGRGDYASTRQTYSLAKKSPDYRPSMGRLALESGGEALGSAFGLGGLGKTAGRHLAHLAGFGDYSVKENVFLSGRLPEVVNMPSGGGTIIRFQEYIGDVVTSTSAGEFNSQEYLINAANSRSFPWLGQLAANYEQYSFEGLIFEFRSTSADALNSTNTALGSVMMATQYDVVDRGFQTKSAMLNYEFSNSVKPSENCLHMIECAPAQTTIQQLYTRAEESVPSGADPRMYHLGRFTIATTGFQGAAVNIGELHVTYQVRLLKPKLYDALGFDQAYASVSLLNMNLNGAVALLGTTRGFSSDTIGLSFPDNNTIQFPVSSVIKTWYIQIVPTLDGTPAVCAGSPVPVVTNGEQVNAGITGLAPPVGTTTGSVSWWTMVRSTSASLPLVVNFVGPSFNVQMNGYLRVFQVPNTAPF